MPEPITDWVKLAHYAGCADQLDDALLHRCSQGAYELGKQVRSCEKAIDREIRKRIKEKERAGYYGEDKKLPGEVGG